MRTREYGETGPWVVVVHGGPGAPGSVAPVARALGADFRVLEPWQRDSRHRPATEPGPLTVARHVDDLEQLIAERCEGTRPAVVGHSWGAMLALAHAADHPDSVSALVLIGCGTFDAAARAELHQRLAARLDDTARDELRRAAEAADADAGLRRQGELMLPLYSHDLACSDLELEDCDALAHAESWESMLRMQREGVYPESFRRIKAPVLMLHGDVDPHPGATICAGLRPHLPQIEYHEWLGCGHYPWLEKHPGVETYERISRWLRHQLDDA